MTDLNVEEQMGITAHFLRQTKRPLRCHGCVMETPRPMGMIRCDTCGGWYCSPCWPQHLESSARIMARGGKDCYDYYRGKGVKPGSYK